MQAAALAQCLRNENDQLRQRSAELAAALQEAQRIIESSGKDDHPAKVAKP
jgi:hypothetical protein